MRRGRQNGSNNADLWEKRDMPIIEVKAFDRRFDSDQAKAEQLIGRLTDAITEVYGEEMRDETWVILEGVKPNHWGFGGRLRG